MKFRSDRNLSVDIADIGIILAFGGWFLMPFILLIVALLEKLS